MVDQARTAAETEADMLECILTTDDAAAARRFLTENLALDPDDTVVSIGCGPGFELEALAEDIGPDGCIIGVDLNEAVVDRARDRCSQRPQVAVERGAATALPVADGSVDVAVAKQVYRFVPELDAALAELHRVLKPAGRAAVMATDVDTMAIHSSNPDRMHRALDVYREAMPHPNLGTRLVSALPAAGLPVERVEARAGLQREITAQIERGIEVHREFMTEDDRFTQPEIDEWERDLRGLAAADEFLSSTTQFLHIARKPS